MPGRQQKFDRSGSPSGTLLIVSREAHEKEIHDGRSRKPIPYEVGVQIPCSFHPEMSLQEVVPGTAAAFGGSIPTAGRAEGEQIEEGHLRSDYVHMMIAIPPKYAVSQVMAIYQGQERDPFGAGVRREEAEFRRSALLGTRVLCVHSGPR